MPNSNGERLYIAKIRSLNLDMRHASRAGVSSFLTSRRQWRLNSDNGRGGGYVVGFNWVGRCKIRRYIFLLVWPSEGSR